MPRSPASDPFMLSPRPGIPYNPPVRVAERTRRVKMEQALDPRRWTRAISDVWHRFIPDVQAAFNALKEEALRK
jgi:hypothetical protein